MRRFDRFAAHSGNDRYLAHPRHCSLVAELHDSQHKAVAPVTPPGVISPRRVQLIRLGKQENRSRPPRSFGPGVTPGGTRREARRPQWGSPRERSGLPTWPALAHCRPMAARFRARRHPAHNMCRAVCLEPQVQHRRRNATARRSAMKSVRVVVGSLSYKTNRSAARLSCG